ncbi:MAG: hypothetical protein JNM95_07680 [Chitinophagaceae bacterium]|nr:hypothetical protein [Chitinophagaceae bacterium]
MGKKALLVENNLLHFEVYENALNQLGYEVITTSDNLPITSFDEAVTAFKANSNIELAIIDIRLNGEKNGIDLASYFIDNHYNIYILFTTEFITDEAATQIAFLNTQIPMIYKPRGAAELQAALFTIKSNVTLRNPRFEIKFDTIELPVYEVPKHKLVRKLELPNGGKSYKRKINKSKIAFIAAGNGVDYDVPKNYSLIVNVDLEHAYLTRNSLQELLNQNILDERFVRISNNICINLKYHMGEAERSDLKNPILLNCAQRKVFEVSSEYKTEFLKRAKMY